MALEEPVIFRRFVADAIGAYIFELPQRDIRIESLSLREQKEAIVDHLERGVKLLHLSDNADQIIIELASIDPTLRKIFNLVSGRPDFFADDEIHDYFKKRGPFIKEKQLEFICSGEEIIDNPADWFNKNFDTIIAEIDPELLKKSYTTRIKYDGIQINELKPLISVCIYAMVYLGHDIDANQGMAEGSIEERYKQAISEREYTVESVTSRVLRADDNPEELVLKLASEQSLQVKSWDDILDR